MIDTQAIRSKILDLAMRGQLTEQLPEDGTAEELYQQIQEEKQKLNKEGKIKKQKPLPEITDEEIPFDIPKNWKWVFLGELFDHNTGKALKTSDRNGQLLEYITTSNLYWDHFELRDLKKMYFKENEIDKCTVKKGDLLVCEGGDIGRSAIWTFDYEMRIQNHIHKLRKYSDLIYTDFYYYLLWLYKQTDRINGIGIGLQGFSSKRVHSLVVPLAPYYEAVRVVLSVKKAFSVLDIIDELQAQYADNLTALKSKLIDAAIQGKLTEQLPEDGTAEELFEQIQEEKQKLIKEGKIKKEKPYSKSPVLESHPFDIPDNWKFVRFGELMINRDSERIPVSVADRRKKKKIYDYYGASGVIDGIDEYLFDEELLLIGEDGANLLARTRPVAFIAKGKYWVNNHAHVLDICCGMNLEYICYYINAISLQPYVTGMAQPKMNQENMNTIWVPLPPLAEQKRIVKKLDEILPLCEIKK